MPNVERDDESGKYTSTYPRKAFVDAVRAADGFAGTQDVADAVGCSYELAYKRLRALADAGDVESQKVANARVWVVTEDTQAAESGRARRETPTADTPVDLDGLTFKRELTPARRAVLAEWVNHVQAADGTVSKSDFEAWFTEDHETRAGYNAGSFWEAFAKATMKQSGRFEQPNARAYRWAGDTEA